MTFDIKEVLSPFNKGNLKKDELIFVSDNLETLRTAVLNNNKNLIFKFNEYSTNLDCPFKSGAYGANSYRYAYRAKIEEMTFKPCEWIKFV